ncbi:MAG TPA: WXG100 family type VII secretion target [Streptomyces sp.]|nr:WXG100 family type VII secretion target [Streptomyces sp.]
MSGANLDVSEDKLTSLASDLDDMQRYLDKQAKRMDAVVDDIAAGWQGTTASAYRDLHQGVTEDMVRIRQVLVLMEEATRLSRDGFTEQELDVVQRMQRVQASVDVAAEARAMSDSGPQQAPAAASAPRSRIDDL